jgi:hypothetical protein
MVDYEIPTAAMLITATTTAIVELHKTNNSDAMSEKGLQQCG